MRMESIKLPGYQIGLGSIENLVDRLDEILAAEWSNVAVLTDDNTEEFCWPLLEDADWPMDAELLTIPSGEQHKTIASCEVIWEEFVRIGMDRHSLLINLGGGVIGDMGGFAASTFMRGFRFVNIPTTLLSQVDASVGGKLGVDFRGLKNMIGLFGDPLEVLICPQFLDTLHPRELVSGYAEVLKHTLIRDRDEWERIKAMDPMEIQDWAAVISRSVKVKRDVVEVDRLESGLRKILNYGHTVGHAIETIMLEDEEPMLHGEAIAYGMVAEAWLSQQAGMISAEDLQAISDVFSRIYPRHDLTRVEAEMMLDHMRHDKKNHGGQISLSLLTAIGEGKPDCQASDDQIIQSLGYVREVFS